VLWLTKGLGPGGAERLLVTHAAVTDSERLTFEAAYLLPHKTHLVADLEANGVATHALDAPNALDPRWLARFRRLVLDGDFDVVHAHSPAPAAQARLVVRSLPVARRPAFVYTEHNRWPSHDRLTRAANQATFNLNDATIAVSNEVRDSITASPPGGVQVIVHGIDVEAGATLASERDATRAELGIAADQFLVVTVANLRAPKGYPDLFAAAQLVVEQMADARFVIVGQGPLEGELRACLADLELGDRVRMLGYRRDAGRITAAADLFVLASHHEGLPVAVMEAFAAGVPVVATDVGGLSEAVESDVSGLLVPARRPDLLAAAVLEIGGDPGRRARLATGALAAAPQFSAERSAREIETVYDRALTVGARRATRHRRWR
jgi:glycosyltransferase involved in cell wall biosynthesis